MNDVADRLTRRSFLRGAGVALSLPLLDAMAPRSPRTAAHPVPRRMVAIQTNMGILPQFFLPEGAGKDYKPSPYLEILDASGASMTVFSGVSHPGVDGGHAGGEVLPDRRAASRQRRASATASRSTSSRPSGSATATRFPSLVTHVGIAMSSSLSLHARRRRDPARAERRRAVSPSMFVQGTRRRGRRAACTTCSRAAACSTSSTTAPAAAARRSGPGDRDRLDQYFTSVRDLETPARSEPRSGRRQPKPVVDVPSRRGRRPMAEFVRQPAS